MARINARPLAPETSFDAADRAGMLHIAGPDAAATTYVQDYTAIVTRNANGTVVSTNGTAGRGSFYSFSFETKVPSYSVGEYSAEAVASVQTFTDGQKDLARAALKAWGDASGLTFFEVAEGQGDMKFVQLQVQLIDPSAAGFAVLPSGTYDGQPSTSDVYVDIESADWLHLYLHEVGHALGLKHPFEGDIQLDKSVDNWTSTVMSYTGDNDGVDQLGTMDYDAIRFLYGDNSNDGKQASSWNWNAATKTLSHAYFDTDETILGIGGRDIIYGNAGNDTIQGREGSDDLHGGEGNDTLLGGFGPGHDKLFGDNGDDVVEVRYGQGSKLTIDGGAGTDEIKIWFGGKASFNFATWAKANPVANMEKTTLSAAGGVLNDRITGGALADTIWAGDGKDVLAGGAGDDAMFGQEGNDRLNAGAGDDRAWGGAGNDTLIGGTGNDQLSGEVGNDKLSGDDGDDTMFGGDGDDTITGGAGVDRVNGDAGKDAIDGGDGDDSLWGLADADTLKGGAGNDYLDGGDGDDVLIGGEGADNMFGGAGIDTVSYAGEKAGVTVTVNQFRVVDGANEFLTGIENLTGTAFADTFTGDAGANVLSGMNGNDTLSGMAGKDRLIGGAGQDSLRGGADADRFVFDDRDSAAGKTAADRILDFSRSEGDKIDLSQIDARAGTAADDAFKAIGGGAFTGVAGELRWTISGGVTFVQGDTDGDKVADFGLLVTGDKLLAVDFVL